MPAWSRSRRPDAVWPVAGYSGKSTVQKLGIKPGFRIFTAGLSGAYRDIVGELPDGVTITKIPKPPLDMVHVFATEAAGLAEKLRVYRAAIAPDGMVWVSWPKKASGVITDLTDVVVRDIALALGLVDVKVSAVDETWSGLKFVIRKSERTG
jgi:hypothetical protein